MASTYFVNEKKVDWKELIRLAKEHGYEEEDGLYTTSRAAQLLRECGFDVHE
jgi:hypothetical protein